MSLFHTYFIQLSSILVWSVCIVHLREFMLCHNDYILHYDIMWLVIQYTCQLQVLLYDYGT